MAFLAGMGGAQGQMAANRGQKLALASTPPPQIDPNYYEVQACTPSKQSLTRIVFAVTAGIVVLTIAAYFRTMRQINQWVAKKKEMQAVAEEQVRQIAASQQFQHLLDLRFLPDGQGFVFIVDDKGHVLAHGDGEQGDELSAEHLNQVTKQAKAGGGYVHLTWKRGKPIVAYAKKVPDSNWIVSAAVPSRHIK